MGVALLLSRLGLAAVFAVAGAAKLADRPGTRKAAVDFGAPEVLAGPLAVAIPLSELAVAALLLPTDTARWGALGALALLTVFSGAIALAIARGRAPDCHCFGQLHSQPAGWKTLGRNGMLAALAALVVVGGWKDGGTSAIDWIAGLDGAEITALVLGIVSLVVVAAGGWGLLNVMRGYGRVLVRLERVEHALTHAGLAVDEAEELPDVGRAPGTAAPAFALRNVLGETVALERLLGRGRPLLLLFTSPTCGPCRTLMPTVAAWQREYADALTIALVSDGDERAIRSDAEENELADMLIDDELAVYRAYEANGTPSAVLVSPDGTVASWVAAGSDWIGRLVRDAVAAAEQDDEGLPVGQPAPELSLPDLAGRRIELTELRGSDVALLFWNPGCGYCRSMHEDLLAWEMDPPAGAPTLVVVSSGDAGETADENFASRVLLDTEFEAGDAFGAGGTPSAVRISADGNVASPLVTGAEGVLALLGVRATSTSGSY